MSDKILPFEENNLQDSSRKIIDELTKNEEIPIKRQGIHEKIIRRQSKVLNEDLDLKKALTNLQNLNKIEEISFNFVIFSKVFLYYLFGILLGPLIILPIYFIDNLNFAKYLGFIGFSQKFFIQFFIYLITIMCLILQIFEIINVTSIDISSAIFGQILYGLIQAISCAYQNIDKNTNFSEILNLESWINLSREKCEEEIKFSLLRNEIELATFSITFIEKITPEFHNLLKNSVQLDEINTTKSHKTTSCDCVFSENFSSIQNPDSKFSASRLAQELILMSKIAIPEWMYWLLIFISILHGLIPGFTRQFINEDGNFFSDINALKFFDIFYTTCCILLNIIIYYGNIRYLLLAVLEFKRKIFIMETLGNCINSSKNLDSIIPLINFFSPQVIFNWLNLRILLMDTGIKFMYQILAFSSCFLILYIGTGVFLLASALGIINYSLSYTFTIFACYEILVALCSILYMIHISAYLNESYENHKYRWISHKSILHNIVLEYDTIMNEECENLLNTAYKRAYIYFSCKNNTFIMNTTPHEVLNSCIKTIKLIIERLSYESEQNSISFVGIVINYDTLLAIYAAIGTIAFILIQIYIPQLRIV